MSIFSIFKKKNKYTTTQPLIESKGKFSKEMSQKEREKLWDEKIERERRLARKEDMEEEKQNNENKLVVKKKHTITKSKIVRGGKALVKHTGHVVEGMGIIANKTADYEVKTAKKIYKHGKPAVKTFTKDMTHAGKVAAKGIGDWADRVIEDKPKRGRRSASTRKPMKRVTGLKASPASININGKKYMKYGSSHSDQDDAKYFADELKHAGYSAIIKRFIVQGHKVSVVYKYKKQVRKTKTNRRVIYRRQPMPQPMFMEAPTRPRKVKRSTKSRKASYEW